MAGTTTPTETPITYDITNPATVVATTPPVAVPLTPFEKADHRSPRPTKVVAETSAPTNARLVSLDAYRGLVMVLMVSAGLGFTKVVENVKNSKSWTFETPFWSEMARQTDHVAWTGFVLWDFIQPSFMFMVGAALAFSLASRQQKGQSFPRMLFHALVRSAILVLLAVFLTSVGKSSTYWIFTNVLAQIGLGYPFLFLAAWLKPRWQIIAAAVILVGYWAAFAFYPAPMDLNPLAVGLKADWTTLTGFAAHWEKNTNLAAYVDQWFLNLFPTPDNQPYWHNDGGYQTLNFVPSLATMILGLLAGELVRSTASAGKKFGVLILAGVATLAAGWALDFLGVCPIIKRIWTPSWTLLSGGVAFLTLAIFYLIIDVARFKKWAYPLVIVGANSIAVYCMSQLLKPWFKESMKRHFGKDIFELPGQFYGYLRYQKFDTGFANDVYLTMGKIFMPIAETGLFLLFCWLVCWWAYRNKVFVKI